MMGMQSLDDVRIQTAVALKSCQHERVHEIGEDFDQDGRLLRLVRCIKCGLLIREYLPAI
jgi:hypothetical protein